MIRIDGTVKARAPELVNPKLPTGEIEVYVRDIEVLGAADELPLPVFGEDDYPEETRLKYRFLDLRRERLHANIMLRSQVIAHLRDAMRAQGFTEFQTPILTASSPEGARDFLVPSRLHPGKFYALPQAPQQFKQLIMVAGFDRYFQIAPCFRDEDPRADRSPGEFYQLDVEMSFATQEDVFAVIEPVMRGVFEEFGGGRPVTPAFPRIAYRDAMLRYGSDKPDLRNPIEMQVVSEHFRGSGFKVFAGLLEQPGTEVRAIPAPGGGSRAFCDRMNAFAQGEGLPGMGYIFWRAASSGGDRGGRARSPRRLGPRSAPRRSAAAAGRRARATRSSSSAGAGEVRGGRRQGAQRHRQGARADRRRTASASAGSSTSRCTRRTRTPASSTSATTPSRCRRAGWRRWRRQDPLDVLGFQYDIVCNGVELSSGAVRNHKPEIMYKAFEIVGHDRAFVDGQFGGMLAAFRFGAPPHAGIAPGVDRIVMLLAGAQNIREVIMFPMNQRAEDLMMGAPSEPTNEQLRELGLQARAQGLSGFAAVAA